MELCLTGGIIGAEEAVSRGLASRVVRPRAPHSRDGPLPALPRQHRPVTGGLHAAGLGRALFPDPGNVPAAAEPRAVRLWLWLRLVLDRRVCLRLQNPLRRLQAPRTPRAIRAVPHYAALCGLVPVTHALCVGRVRACYCLPLLVTACHCRCLPPNYWMMRS